TGSILHQAAKGSGYSIVNGKRLDWTERDIFCVPSWAFHEHANASQTADACAAARLGALVGDSVIDLNLLAARANRVLPASMLELIDMGPAAWRTARTLLDEFDDHWPEGTAWPLQNVKLLAPIPRPRKNIFGIGLNYVEHVAESARTLDTSKDLPKQPVIFSKPPTTVIGPGDAIEHNAEVTRQLDWE